MRHDTTVFGFSGPLTQLVIFTALFATPVMAADLQTEWDAVAAAAAAASDDGNGNYLFDVENAANNSSYFLETPGPNNWVGALQRTITGPDNAQPCDDTSQCDAVTQEQCVRANAFLTLDLGRPPANRCLAGTALIYARMLNSIEQCGHRCFVDVASLRDTRLLSPMVAAAVAFWANRADIRNDAQARLFLRITEGYYFETSMPGELVRNLSRFLDPRRGQIRREDLEQKVWAGGVNFSAGSPLLGRWSHAKIFAVLDADNPERNIAMVGSQNHYAEAFFPNRPFEGNLVLLGRWARAPSLAMDGAIGVSRIRSFYNYSVDYANPGEWAWWPVAPRAQTMLGPPNRNLSPADPAQNIIAMSDQGDFSRNVNDRLILRSLGQVTRIQRPQDGNTIFAWVQGFCNFHCGGRYRGPDTFVRTVAEHIVNPDEMGADASNIRLFMAGNNESHSLWAGGNPYRVAISFTDNGAYTACGRWFGFQPGYERIKWGNANCWQSVYRLVPRRSRLRVAIADFRDLPQLFIPTGQHHKIFVFDNAVLISSFNPYPSTANRIYLQDSKLIENGTWTFDQATRNLVMTNAETAWQQSGELSGNYWGPDHPLPH